MTVTAAKDSPPLTASVLAAVVLVEAVGAKPSAVGSLADDVVPVGSPLEALCGSRCSSIWRRRLNSATGAPLSVTHFQPLALKPPSFITSCISAGEGNSVSLVMTKSPSASSTASTPRNVSTAPALMWPFWEGSGLGWVRRMGHCLLSPPHLRRPNPACSTQSPWTPPRPFC